MTLDEVIARESIRRALAGYTLGGDSRDRELFLGQFAENATFEFAGFPPLPSFRCDGLEAIRAYTANWVKLPVEDPAFRRVSFIRHNLTMCHIVVTSGDTATAKTYFVVYTDIGPDHAGIYSDEMVRQGERWLFLNRRITLDWRSPDSIYPPVKR